MKSKKFIESLSYERKQRGGTLEYTYVFILKGERERERIRDRKKEGERK